jgi:hypothetical protein
MNERDIPSFDARGVESIIERYINKRPEEFALAGIFVPSDVYFQKSEIEELSKQIIEYAARCGVIPSQSTMK